MLSVLTTHIRVTTTTTTIVAIIKRQEETLEGDGHVYGLGKLTPRLTEVYMLNTLNYMSITPHWSVSKKIRDWGVGPQWARVSVKARAPRGHSRNEGAANRREESWPEGLWVAKSGLLSSLRLSPSPCRELSRTVQCLLTYVPSGRWARGEQGYVRLAPCKHCQDPPSKCQERLFHTVGRHSLGVHQINWKNFQAFFKRK